MVMTKAGVKIPMTMRIAPPTPFAINPIYAHTVQLIVNAKVKRWSGNTVVTKETSGVGSMLHIASESRNC
jgi:hypothetical protein